VKQVMRLINKHLRNKKGFTLIELMVVIAVLGILALLIAPRFMGTKEDAKKAVDAQTMAQMQEAINLAIAQDPNGKIPDSATEATKAIEKVMDKIPASKSGVTWWYNTKSGKMGMSDSSSEPDTDSNWVKIEPTVSPSPAPSP